MLLNVLQVNQTTDDGANVRYYQRARETVYNEDAEPRYSLQEMSFDVLTEDIVRNVPTPTENRQGRRVYYVFV